MLSLIKQLTYLHWEFNAVVSVSFEFDLTGVIYMHYRFMRHRNKFEEIGNSGYPVGFIRS